MSFFNGNLLEDFLYQIGSKLDASYEIPENVNQSMSYAGIRILSNLNEIFLLQNMVVLTLLEEILRDK